MQQTMEVDGYYEDLEFRSEVDRLVDESIDLMRIKYADKKEYHNDGHVRLVVGAIEKMGKELLDAGKISFKKFHLMRLAAAAHDLDSDHGKEGTSEELSAEIIEKIMLESPKSFDSSDIAFVRKLIMGTKFYFDSFGVMHQDAEHIDKDDPDFLPVQVMADADLVGIGLPSFEESLNLSKKFADELRRDRDGLDFYAWQSKFLSGREYLTDVAKEFYGANLQRNSEEVHRRYLELSRRAKI